MPSGAKKRKALKKKKQLEAFGACPSNKGINDHGILSSSLKVLQVHTLLS